SSSSTFFNFFFSAYFLMNFFRSCRPSLEEPFINVAQPQRASQHYIADKSNNIISRHFPRLEIWLQYMDYTMKTLRCQR
ncbi:hypothetical protein QWJ34_25495, partial [Saccharibacillus sp. CPCC 101409]|uniref:hypothetical protein n=1 Tax=Saccharibacillus sp. CPCC 101409 TaxID=3058041 RepID=UPI0026722F13